MNSKKRVSLQVVGLGLLALALSLLSSALAWELFFRGLNPFSELLEFLPILALPASLLLSYSSKPWEAKIYFLFSAPLIGGSYISESLFVLSFPLVPFFLAEGLYQVSRTQKSKLAPLFRGAWILLAAAFYYTAWVYSPYPTYLALASYGTALLGTLSLILHKARHAKGADERPALFEL